MLIIQHGKLFSRTKLSHDLDLELLDYSWNFKINKRTFSKDQVERNLVKKESNSQHDLVYEVLFVLFLIDVI